MTVVYRTRDRHKIHAFLLRDPIWGAYAMGDLEAAYFSQCTWYLAGSFPEGSDGLALLYRGLDPPVVLTMGRDTAIAAILRVADLPERAYMSAQEDHLPAFQVRYDFSGDRVRPMVRMAVSAGRFRPHRADLGNRVQLRRLDGADVPEVQGLLAYGGSYAPDAFRSSQVDQGIFYGLWQDEELVAVAGTHLVASTMGVAAVGNIYTDPGWRGRGYGSAVTSAVTADLVEQGFLVVLNVDRDNQVATRLYRKLGYQVHCFYVEGIGLKRSMMASDQVQLNQWGALETSLDTGGTSHSPTAFDVPQTRIKRGEM